MLNYVAIELNWIDGMKWNKIKWNTGKQKLFVELQRRALQCCKILSGPVCYSVLQCGVVWYMISKKSRAITYFCPALPCPALPCPTLPCPTLPWLVPYRTALTESNDWTPGQSRHTVHAFYSTCGLLLCTCTWYLNLLKHCTVSFPWSTHTHLFFHSLIMSSHWSSDAMRDVEGEKKLRGSCRLHAWLREWKRDIGDIWEDRTGKLIE